MSISSKAWIWLWQFSSGSVQGNAGMACVLPAHLATTVGWPLNLMLAPFWPKVILAPFSISQPVEISAPHMLSEMSTSVRSIRCPVDVLKDRSQASVMVTV